MNITDKKFNPLKDDCYFYNEDDFAYFGYDSEKYLKQVGIMPECIESKEIGVAANGKRYLLVRFKNNKVILDGNNPYACMNFLDNYAI